MLAAVPLAATGKDMLPCRVSSVASSSYGASMGDGDSPEKHIVVRQRRGNVAERETLKKKKKLFPHFIFIMRLKVGSASGFNQKHMWPVS